MTQYKNGTDATDGIYDYALLLDVELQTLHTMAGYDNTTGLGVPRVPELIRAFGRKPLVRFSCDSGGIPTSADGCVPVYQRVRR